MNIASLPPCSGSNLSSYLHKVNDFVVPGALIDLPEIYSIT